MNNKTVDKFFNSTMKPSDFKYKMETNNTTYKTQWRAFFKQGLGSPAIVYGESEEEAMRNALAFYRKNVTDVDMLPRSMVVDHVEMIG